MSLVQQVVLPDGTRTHTITGPDHLPVPAAEEYLAYLRLNSSPNTVKSYATSISQWLTVLDDLECQWNDFPTQAFGEFIKYVRTGDLPTVERISASPIERAPSTVQNRVAAILAFYTWQSDANGHHSSYERLYSSKRKAGRNPHLGYLHGIAQRKENNASIYRIRPAQHTRAPVLTPTHVKTILDDCSVQTADGNWTGGPCGVRDRLLFATMIETGMRIGQALSLRNQDWNIGAGNTPWIDLVPRQDHPHQVRNKTNRTYRVYIGDDLEALYSAYIWHLVEHGIEAFIDDINHHFTFVNIAQGKSFAPMRPETVHAKRRSITRRNPQLPRDWTTHWLRHTHASALLLAGVQPHVVMRRLGHAHIQTTLEKYGWVTEDAELRSIATWHDFTSGWGGIHE